MSYVVTFYGQAPGFVIGPQQYPGDTEVVEVRFQLVTSDTALAARGASSAPYAGFVGKPAVGDLFADLLDEAFIALDNSFRALRFRRRAGGFCVDVTVDTYAHAMAINNAYMLIDVGGVYTSGGIKGFGDFRADGIPLHVISEVPIDISPVIVTPVPVTPKPPTTPPTDPVKPDPPVVVTPPPVTPPKPTNPKDPPGPTKTTTDTFTLPGGVKIPKIYAYGLGALGVLLLLR